MNQTALEALNLELEQAEAVLADPRSVLTIQERRELEAAVEHGTGRFIEAVAAEGGLDLFMALLTQEIAQNVPNEVPEEWEQ